MKDMRMSQAMAQQGQLNREQAIYRQALEHACEYLKNLE
jgi:uncharacterized protein HemX